MRMAEIPEQDVPEAEADLIPAVGELLRAADKCEQQEVPEVLRHLPEAQPREAPLQEAMVQAADELPEAAEPLQVHPDIIMEEGPPVHVAEGIAEVRISAS